MDNELLADPKRVAELWQTLHRAARYRGATATEADDIVQSSFVKALESPPNVPGRLIPWMRTVAERFVYRSKRSARNRSHREQTVAKVEAQGSVLDALEEESHRATLRAIVEDLSAPYGEVVRLRYFEELSVAEIAVRLGRRPDSVRKQISRGMRLLRERFQPRNDWRERVLAFVGFRFTPNSKLAASTITLAVASVLALAIWFLIGRDTQVEHPSDSVALHDQAQQPPAQLAQPSAGEAVLARVAEPAPTLSAAPYTVLVLGKGGPVAGAAIRASTEHQLDLGPVLGTTDEHGRFVLEDVDRTAWVSASYERMFPSHRILLQSIGATRELVLHLGESAGQVTGSVQAQSGEKLVGAKVTLAAATSQTGKVRARSNGRITAQPASRVAFTDEDGSFQLTKLPGNRYRLCVEAEGHAPYIEFIASAAARDRRVRCVMPPAATLSGTLRDSNSTPVPDALVSLRLQDPLQPVEVITDAFGAYKFELLPAGPVTLSASGPEAASRDSALASIDLGEGESVTFDLQLSSNFTLLGRATDEQRGVLDGWVVELSASTDSSSRASARVTQTDSTGMFAFPACDPKRPYRLRLFPPGDGQSTPHATLDPVYAQGSVVELLCSERSTPTCKVRGQANTSIQNMPALVQLRSKALGDDLYLDINPETGEFQSPLVPPGDYVLRASTPEVGFGETFRFTLLPGENKTVALDSATDAQLVTFDVPQLSGMSSEQAQSAFVLVKGDDYLKRFHLLASGATLPVDIPHGRYSFAVKRAAGWADAYGSFVVDGGGPVNVSVPLVAGESATIRVGSIRPLLDGESVQLFVQTPRGLEEVIHTRPLSPHNKAAVLELNANLPSDCESLKAVTNSLLEGEIKIDRSIFDSSKPLHIELAESQAE